MSNLFLKRLTDSSALPPLVHIFQIVFLTEADPTIGHEWDFSPMTFMFNLLKIHIGPQEPLMEDGLVEGQSGIPTGTLSS